VIRFEGIEIADVDAGYTIVNLRKGERRLQGVRDVAVSGTISREWR